MNTTTTTKAFATDRPISASKPFGVVECRARQFSIRRNTPAFAAAPVGLPQAPGVAIACRGDYAAAYRTRWWNAMTRHAVWTIRAV